MTDSIEKENPTLKGVLFKVYNDPNNRNINLGEIIDLFTNIKVGTKEAVEKDYEKETGLLIVKHFKELGLNPSEINMVLCGGHGPFAWGETAAKSVYNGTVMEEICKMALNTLALNPNANELPSYIVDKHYLRIMNLK